MPETESAQNQFFAAWRLAGVLVLAVQAVVDFSLFFHDLVLLSTPPLNGISGIGGITGVTGETQ